MEQGGESTCRFALHSVCLGMILLVPPSPSVFEHRLDTPPTARLRAPPHGLRAPDSRALVGSDPAAGPPRHAGLPARPAQP